MEGLLSESGVEVAGPVTGAEVGTVQFADSQSALKELELVAELVPCLQAGLVQVAFGQVVQRMVVERQLMSELEKMVEAEVVIELAIVFVVHLFVPVSVPVQLVALLL